MNVSEIPVWFLVLSLFLPRISLLVAYFNPGTFPHVCPLFVAILMSALIPRVLVLIAIGTLMGIGVWFWIHLGFLVLVWLSSSVRVSNSRK